MARRDSEEMPLSVHWGLVKNVEILGFRDLEVPQRSGAQRAYEEDGGPMDSAVKRHDQLVEDRSKIQTRSVRAKSSFDP